jgi:hypothetical protein
VLSLLCSPHAQQTLPGSALLSTIALLSADLEEWHRESADMMTTTLQATTDAFERLHLLRLRLAYHSCCAAVKRPLCPAFDMALWGPPPPPQPFAGFADCLQSAREIMAYIGVIDRLQLNVFYSEVLSLVGGAIILFTNILHDPRAECAAGDQAGIERLAEQLREKTRQEIEGFGDLFILTLALAGVSRELVCNAAAERLCGSRE